MFDYFDESSQRGFKVVIGKFVSHSMEWHKDGKLLTVEEINSLNRMKLAEQFIKGRTHNGKYKIDTFYTVIKPYEFFEIENDIAQFIDLKIPKNYWIRLQENSNGYHDRSEVSKGYKGIDSIDGLEFVYPDNYHLEFHW